MSRKSKDDSTSERTTRLSQFASSQQQSNRNGTPSRGTHEPAWWWVVATGNLMHSSIVAISCVLFSLWTREIQAPWLQLLFGAEAAIQALLALSGFIHYSTRKVFSYSQHLPLVTILIRSLVIMLHFIRVILIFNPEYDVKIPIGLGIGSVILAVATPVRTQRLFATLFIVNLVMAIRIWNAWAVMYSLNAFLAAFSKGRYPGILAEIVNIGIWYGMKVTLAP